MTGIELLALYLRVEDDAEHVYIVYQQSVRDATRSEVIGVHSYNDHGLIREIRLHGKVVSRENYRGCGGVIVKVNVSDLREFLIGASTKAVELCANYLEELPCYKCCSLPAILFCDGCYAYRCAECGCDCDVCRR